MIVNSCALLQKKKQHKDELCSNVNNIWEGRRQVLRPKLFVPQVQCVPKRSEVTVKGEVVECFYCCAVEKEMAVTVVAT